MKYPYIQAWGTKLTSLQYYIKSEKDRAEKDNAPDDAIYFSIERQRWIRVTELEESNPDLKVWLDKEVSRYTEKVEENCTTK